MTCIIKEITDHLDQYRSNSLQLKHLSIEDVSLLKGCQIRSQKKQEVDYKRSWAKLAKAQRLNRMMNYHQKLTIDYKLDSKSQQQLKTLFYDSINSDILDNNNINYNINEGVIVKIEGLKRDTEDFFYFESPSTKPGLTTHVPAIKKFTPVSVSQLSIAQKRQKPLITLKPSGQNK